MSDVLDRICARKREHVAARRAAVSEAEIQRRAAAAGPVRGFAARIGDRLDAGRYALIGEIKKASPSKGLIRADFDPAVLARAYESGGAACISVLTDMPYFQGHDDYLAAARGACALPVLRKDFMLEPYQVYEARAIGADAILLIMAALPDDMAATLCTLAGSLGLDVLVEVHDAAEMDRALRLDARLIGINNRNLKTLSVDIGIAEQLAPRVPADRIVVAESGLSSRADLDRMAAAGARCFLIGESLMRRPDVTAATRALLQPGGDALQATA
ncbi:MAG: indole-3-glycerol phosphate synthase TrpC [Alphaproteobacteria bacterium]